LRRLFRAAEWGTEGPRPGLQVLPSTPLRSWEPGIGSDRIGNLAPHLCQRLRGACAIPIAAQTLQLSPCVRVSAEEEAAWSSRAARTRVPPQTEEGKGGEAAKRRTYLGWVGAALAAVVVASAFVTFSGRAEVKGKPTTELGGGTLQKEEVQQEWWRYDTFFQQSPGAGREGQEQLHPSLPTPSHNLVDGYLRMGVGPKLPFLPWRSLGRATRSPPACTRCTSPSFWALRRV